jgi:hypothetical protein
LYPVNDEIEGVADEVNAAISIEDPETRTFFQLAILCITYKYHIPKKKSPDAE